MNEEEMYLRACRTAIRMLNVEYSRAGIFLYKCGKVIPYEDVIKWLDKKIEECRR